MPLFRFHRGSLEASLQTTIIVKELNDIILAIVTSELVQATGQDWEAKFCIKPYPEEGHNFDVRIGWFTQIVTANVYEKDVMHVVGFLSEPLWEIKDEKLDRFIN
jgi:hypothetical protein